MLKLFRKNMIVQVLLVVAVLLVMWGRALLMPTPMTDGGAVLYHLLYTWLSPLPLLAVIMAMLLVLAGGIALNLLLADVGLVPQTSLLPTVLYIVIMSAPATTLTPIIIVNAILIGFTQQLMLRTTLLTIPTSKICSATALIGLCSMIYLPSIAMMVTYLLVVISYRLYGWRDWLSMLLGLLAPYVALITVLFLTNGLTPWWNATTEALASAGLHYADAPTASYIASSFLLLVVVVSVFIIWSRLGEHTIVWQKNATAVMLLSVGTAIMLLYSSLMPADVTVFAVPFALCAFYMFLPEKQRAMGNNRGTKRREWIADILFILTIAAALIC